MATNPEPNLKWPRYPMPDDIQMALTDRRLMNAYHSRPLY